MELDILPYLYKIPLENIGKDQFYAIFHITAMMLLRNKESQEYCMKNHLIDTVVRWLKTVKMNTEQEAEVITIAKDHFLILMYEMDAHFVCYSIEKS